MTENALSDGVLMLWEGLHQAWIQCIHIFYFLYFKNLNLKFMIFIKYFNIKIEIN